MHHLQNRGFRSELIMFFYGLPLTAVTIIFLQVFYAFPICPKININNLNSLINIFDCTGKNYTLWLLLLLIIYCLAVNSVFKKIIKKQSKSIFQDINS